MRRLFASATCLTLVAAAGLLLAPKVTAQADRAVEVSRAHFNANRQAYGLVDPASELRVRGQRGDRSGATHVKFDQYYRGIRVFEGEAIAHVSPAGDVTVTNGIRGNINIDVGARVPQNAAVAAALRSISPLGAYAVADASLVVLPRGERSVVDRLTWQVVVRVENEFQDPAEWHDFVDARTGDVVFAFDGLETADYTGTANTMYSGSGLPISIDLQGTSYYLRDVKRSAGNVTCDMRNTQANCYYIIQSSPIFGNGTVSTTGVTAAADAHYGLQATWDFYKNTFARNGIDGK
jgi:Zn-dependent metalloprotease